MVSIEAIPALLHVLVVGHEGLMILALRVLVILLGSERGDGESYCRISLITKEMDPWDPIHRILTRVVESQDTTTTTTTSSTSTTTTTTTRGNEVLTMCFHCVESLLSVLGMKSKLMEGKGMVVLQLLLDSLRRSLPGDDEVLTVNALRLFTKVAGGSDRVREQVGARAVQYAYLTLQRRGYSSLLTWRALEVIALLSSSAPEAESPFKANLVTTALQTHGHSDPYVARYGAMSVVAIAR